MTENTEKAPAKNPIQPLSNDAHGVLRFKPNAIVQHLLDTHSSCDMNTLRAMNFTNDDRQQFAQLIGYSLSGYGDLRSYVDDESYSVAVHVADSIDERDARITVLEKKLADLRAFVITLREPMAQLFEMHPDDL